MCSFGCNLNRVRPSWYECSAHWRNASMHSQPDRIRVRRSSTVSHKEAWYNTFRKMLAEDMAAKHQWKSCLATSSLKSAVFSGNTFSKKISNDVVSAPLNQFLVTVEEGNFKKISSFPRTFEGEDKTWEFKNAKLQLRNPVGYSLDFEKPSKARVRATICNWSLLAAQNFFNSACTNSQWLSKDNLPKTSWSKQHT